MWETKLIELDYVHPVFFIRDIAIFGIGLSLHFFSILPRPVPNFVPYFFYVSDSLSSTTLTTIINNYSFYICT